ncbi:uncharacterized protein BKCO1_5300096 [Diplodia corticola]|uniref:Uncharacterized protein n=1 Tax=Diplodia corticola TaxID=236234 RepID=A0A1J9RRD8_9PEZI|nr:uncharacterized protein BKCO1_5300096 [Diplodia corticola]OJD30999.1 hypothetical protein BKCO1_5300096 [Diplodia corticola]
MSRLYSYIFGNRHQQEMESRLQLLEKKLEEAEIMGRYRDAKLIALLDRTESLETEFRRLKTASLQQTTALEEQLVHARQARSNSILHPLQPITDAAEVKPAIASADVFLFDYQTAQPVTVLKFVDCIPPATLEHSSEASATHLDEPFLKNKLKGILEACGWSAPPDAWLYRCDTMSRIHDSEELGVSAKDMYQSNGKGQIAYCLCDSVGPQGPNTALLGSLEVQDPEKPG